MPLAGRRRSQLPSASPPALRLAAPSPGHEQEMEPFRATLP